MNLYSPQAHTMAGIKPSAVLSYPRLWRRMVAAAVFLAVLAYLCSFYVIKINEVESVPRVVLSKGKRLRSVVPPKIGILSVIGTFKHLERDAEALSAHQCYAVQQGYQFIIETHVFRKDFYNKQAAMLKYLPYFDWLLYVDGDTYFVNKTMRVEQFLDTEHHVVLQESALSPYFGFNAGVVLVKNSDYGRRFLQSWLEYSSYDYYNADNGALQLLFANLTLLESNNSCDQYLLRPAGNYTAFFPCWNKNFNTTTFHDFNHPYIKVYGRNGRTMVTYSVDNPKSFIYHGKEVDDKLLTRQDVECDPAVDKTLWT